MIIKSVNLETVCGITSKLPENEFSEFAFAGKSNVGKSSLINGLISRKAYARTSAEPGKTQTINYYKVEYREKSQKEIEAQGLDASYAQDTSVTPAAFAARSFSFKPPIASTRPRSVISPVIATSGRTAWFVTAERIAVAIVIPALGPSFGTAPSGI